MKTDEEYNQIQQEFLDELNRQIKFHTEQAEFLKFAERLIDMLVLVAFIAVVLVLEYTLL